jgi:hypothetical protein
MEVSYPLLTRAGHYFLKLIIQQSIERVRRQTALKLFLCATDVQTAKVKVFTGKELPALYARKANALRRPRACFNVPAPPPGT